jgi:hypothetical protein
MITQSGSTFGSSGRGRAAFPQVPALGLAPASGKPGEPSPARLILARENEALNHGGTLFE